jgi:hypothetical protein
MPSSISNFESAAEQGSAFARPGFVTQTASDRPGVAQPVPERYIPARPWGRVHLVSLLLTVLLIGGWELHWRGYGGEPSYRNSNGSWAEQRRRIDTGEGEALVLIGSSRTLFDIQLPVWQEVAGERPIQLALEGTSAVPILEDLAADPNFTGRLVVGVTPNLFFLAFATHGDVLPYFHNQRPSQRVGHWLSQHLIEPYFAFDNSDFALGEVVERQDWPVRPGKEEPYRVRKLAVSEADRNTHMWSKVEEDPAYRELARSVWLKFINSPPPPFLDTPEKTQAVIKGEIGKAVAAVQKLRARGAKVVFLRLPSAGPYHEAELASMPRELTWDKLLEATGAKGLNFEDYPEMQNYDLPEWSHVSTADSIKLTRFVAPLLEKALAETE